VASGNSSRNHYDQEQSHQQHAVTKDSLKSVREQASDLTQNTNQVSQTRENVESLQAEHSQAIKTESSGVLNHGAALKQEVYTEQDKGVTRRVVGKAGKEVMKTGEDIINAAKNIKIGESQQK
jgi:hypothetical protein